MIPKDIALGTLRTIANQARLMIAFLDAPSNDPYHKDIALNQINASEEAMRVILNMADQKA